MTLSGNAARQQPGVDTLAAVPLGIVTHLVREADNRGAWSRVSAGPNMFRGHVDADTGTYRTSAGEMTEAERRAAGRRRNGQPRNRKTAGR